jgi:hypothetical protein
VLAGADHVTVRAGQWNVGLKGAPPAEPANPVAGDPALHAAELWFMTPSSYELLVSVDGPAGHGEAIVPVLALATAERSMMPGLGAILLGLGIFLTAGMLTIIASALRESVLPPGVEPDASRRRRARLGVVVGAVLAGLVLWGGNAWWNAEAASYGRFVLYRPFASQATLAGGVSGSPPTLTLSIRDPRWTGQPLAASRYNALIPDHGKLMHLFLVREPALDAMAHLHPVARTAEALDFDSRLPPLPAGQYRVYGDIVHESGYAQTLVSSVEVPPPPPGRGPMTSSDPDDSWTSGSGIAESPSPSYIFEDGSRLVWARGESALTQRTERLLEFSLQDQSGATLPVEPYMGMAAHVVVASQDGSVFAHLHPSGSVSMAALQKFAEVTEKGDGGGAMTADPHAGHEMPLAGQVSIPYGFPKAGPFRIWVQMKRNGQVRTGVFDASIEP